MKVRIFIVLIVTLVIIQLFYMLSFKTPKVLAIHGPGSNKDLLVKNMPFTDSNKIKWWDNNGVKLISSSQTYYVSVWNFDGKYQKLTPKNSGWFPDHDIDYLLCFNDIKAEENCIDKENWIIDIIKAKDGYIYYRLDGNEYYRKPSGELIDGERFKTTIK